MSGCKRNWIMKGKGKVKVLLIVWIPIAIVALKWGLDNEFGLFLLLMIGVLNTRIGFDIIESKDETER